MNGRTALAASLLALLTGCSGASEKPRANGDNAVTTSSVTQADLNNDADRASLRSAVESYSSAYLSGDAERARALLSARCQQRISLDELRALATGAKGLYGTAKMTSFEITTLSGPLARVTYRYDVPAIDQLDEPWARQDGQWRNDDC